MNKKGFTLIELLAVITVITIVILITAPIIMRVITDARRGSAKDSMYMYVTAVETASNANPKLAGILNGTYLPKKGSLYLDGNLILKVDSKGLKPADDFGYVIIVKGDVTEAKLSIGGYIVIYKNKKATIEGDAEATPTPKPTSKPTPIPPKKYEIGEVVYYDPISKVGDCSAGKEWTPANTGTTCYKWNVIKDNELTVEVLLDHNTSGNVNWNNSGDSDNGPTNLLDNLKTDTTSWTLVETLTSSDNVNHSNANSGGYTINYSGYKGRLITINELMAINDVDYTTLTTTYGPAGSSMPKNWLYPNLENNSCTENTHAYWTDSCHDTDRIRAWAVSYSGNMLPISVYNYYDKCAGVRPVAKILKSKL